VEIFRRLQQRSPGRYRPTQCRTLQRGLAKYSTFPPPEAQRILRKLELHYTPVHGSWLNMAEIELSALARQCLSRRIGTKGQLEHEVQAWQQQRNEEAITVNWRFTTADARIKLKRLYPSLEKKKSTSSKRSVAKEG
jgi:hypothetical protein